jgi:uroporphyrinogen III methyltransferase / synthase
MRDSKGQVYLVGAGLGGVEYLTMQAHQLITTAQVLVYDALVSSELVQLIPDSCESVFVGKRGGQPSTSQGEINQLLVDYCRSGKQVVRLKSGDPFIFGRISAEIETLIQHGCDFQVVPGLSSALAAPLLAGIPLTDPVLSRGFMVVTAHEPDVLAWEIISGVETLVFLMGGQQLPEILHQLQKHDRSPATPIALIRWAGTPQQQVWQGTLSNIQAQLPPNLSPVVIVVGEVVRLRDYLGQDYQRQKQEALSAQSTNFTNEVPTQESSTQESSTQESSTQESLAGNSLPLRATVYTQAMKSSQVNTFSPPSHQFWGDKKITVFQSPPEYSLRHSREGDLGGLDKSKRRQIDLSVNDSPLRGQTILITRAATQASEFAHLLQAQGARVLEMPTLEIVPPSSWQELDRSIDQLDSFQWLILTSANAVEYFIQRLLVSGKDLRSLAHLKIAVVGSKTAHSLQTMGINADFVPPEFVADSLVANFPETLMGLRILFPRVETGGREILVQEMTTAGAAIVEVAAYQSCCPKEIAPPILMALQQEQVDIITFTSSKGVQHFWQMLQRYGVMSNIDSGDEEHLLKELNPVFRIKLSRDKIMNRVLIAAIGPQTAKSCQATLGRVDIEAEEYTLEGLAQSIVQQSIVQHRPR